LANSSYTQQTKSIISPKEARKLLGKKSNNLTNKELENLITQTETVVRLIVRRYIGSKSSKNNAIIGTDMRKKK